MKIITEKIKLMNKSSYLHIMIAAIILFVAFNGCEKEVFTGITESSPTNFGRIFISSNPQGYKIFIDKRNMSAVTPDTISWLSEGTHRIELRSDIFTDSTFNIVIGGTNVQPLTIDMMSNPHFYGYAICESTPTGAQIYLNDKITAYKTPALIKGLYPGTYKVKFSKSNCRDDSITTIIKGGELTELSKTLEDTTFGVSYRTVTTNIQSDYLSKIVIDKYNNKWIGTLDHGLIKFNGKTFTSYENAGVISGKHITDILIDSKQRMWVGTAIGLSVYDGSSWQILDDKLPSKYIFQIEEDHSGNIWLATANGLVKYNNSTFQLFNKSNSRIPANVITCLTIGSNGDIWFGTDQLSVGKYSTDERWISYPRLESWTIPANVGMLTQDIVFDKSGYFWSYQVGNPLAGTIDALLRYDMSSELYGNWEKITLPFQFAPVINSFYVGKDNTIWMACVNGVFRYNATGIAKYYNSIDYGFYTKNCSSIQVDANGDVWVATNGSGLVKIKKAYL